MTVVSLCNNILLLLIIPLASSAYNLSKSFNKRYFENDSSFVEEFHGEAKATRIFLMTGTVIFIIDILIFSFTMWRSTKLFSSGKIDKKFLKGGGYWMMIAGFIGLVLGIICGYFIDPFSIMFLAGSFMLIGLSVVLVGRRGSIVGACGSVQAGIIIGIIFSTKVTTYITELIFFLFTGITIGFVPFAPNLKVNSRYIQLGLRGQEDNEETPLVKNV